jgi:heat-inducible transcriptional repressor
VEGNIMPQLKNARQRMIFEAAVLDYIRTGEPVASGNLAERYFFSLSPATIRKILAELESLGLLRQAHASAGRTPTEAGFRLYVDEILEAGRLPVLMRAAIEKELSGWEPGSLFGLCSRLLSNLTNQMGVALAPLPELALLKRIYFLRLGQAQILAVLISPNGVIQNRILAPLEDYSQDVLNQVNAVLEGLAPPFSLEEVKSRVIELMGQDRQHFEALYLKVISLAEQAGAVSAQNDDRDIIMDEEGRGRLLDHPDFKDAEAMRSLFKAFENKRRLIDLLDEITGGGRVRVVIGPTGDERDGLALVASPYFSRGQAAGSLGVLGPRRLNYTEIVPVVDYAARVLSGLFDH